MSDPVLEIRGLTARFDGSTALEDVSLEVREGELLAIVGPSGCGKSTLLNAVSGLLGSEAELRGDIVLADGFRLGYAFQKDALLPWFTALRNVEVGAEMRGLAREERRRVATDLLRMVHLEGGGHLYPGQLSGGMRQRVALARVLAYDPDLILLDEPFGALDAFTRMALQNELLAIWRRTRKTMILVTHDLPEALSLGTRLIVMRSRPGAVHLTLELDWPEDRSVEELRSTDEFLKKFSEVWEVLIAVGAAASGEAESTPAARDTVEIGT